MSPGMMNFLMGTLAVLAGALVNYLGDKLLGVRLELFWGISTFSPIWVVDLFVVPFFAGLTVSLIYGLGGKILSYFAPLIPRIASYIYIYNYEGLPDGVSLLPLAFWVLILILTIEAAAFGGVMGEIVVKKTYGRRPKELVYKQKASRSSALLDSEKQ